MINSLVSWSCTKHCIWAQKLCPISLFKLYWNVQANSLSKDPSRQQMRHYSHQLHLVDGELPSEADRTAPNHPVHNSTSSMLHATLTDNKLTRASITVTVDTLNTHNSNESITFSRSAGLFFHTRRSGTKIVSPRRQIWILLSPHVDWHSTNATLTTGSSTANNGSVPLQLQSHRVKQRQQP